MTLSPFTLCVLCDRGPGGARAADRPCDDRRPRSSTCCSPGSISGTAAEQILNGLFNSYVLLAVPLFILAADLMNIGSLTDRLLRFCLVLVGRFRGGLGHVNVVANVIFAGMSGSAIADAVGIGRIIIGMMTLGREVSGRLCGRDHRLGRHHRPDHPALDPDGPVRTGLGHLDRLPVPRRRAPGLAARRRLHGHQHVDRAAAELSGRARAAARPAARSRSMRFRR